MYNIYKEKLKNNFHKYTKEYYRGLFCLKSTLKNIIIQMDPISIKKERKVIKKE